MSQPLSLADIRKNYSLQELTENSVLADPVLQFERWLNEALKANLEEPTAMVLSTASASGKPSARVVLLKGVENGRFIFFTNYQSRKGLELTENPFAALTFFWAGLERQFRLEGKITRLSEMASDAYFHSRPRGSQIGAWASPQSQPVATREQLQEAEAYFEDKFMAQAEIPRPAHWGGFALEPDFAECWQGRPNRLHDRIVYERTAGNTWQIKRLAP